MKSVLMSIRANISATIFKSWTKRLEYRSRWNSDFKGRVYVYESGKDGGKVAGFFDVGRVIKAYRTKDISTDDLLFLDTLDDHNFNEFFSIKETAARPYIYAVEILNPCRFDKPMCLEEFSKAKGCTVQRAPQSWQYIDTATDYEYGFTAVPLAAPTEGVTPTEEFMKKRGKNEQ